MPYLNNKQNKNANQIISRQQYHLTQPCPSEEKQTNKQTSAQISPYKKLTQTTGPNLKGRNQKEERIQPWSLGKVDLKHNKFKKINNKKAENTTQMKQQTRNTEVQINKEEIGKLPEKVFRIMIVKMIKNLENKREKMQ